MSNDSEDDSDKEEEAIQVEGSNIYFYSEVSDESITKLILSLKKLDKKLRKQAIEFEGYKPKIKLFIRSGGGDVYAGFSGMDHIRSLKTPVTTIADGFCASAATFLLMAGRVRMATPSAYILIHQISSGSFWGKYEDLKDEMKSCNKLMIMLKKIYNERTELPEKKLKKLMKRDIILSAEQCLEFKIVDRIACP
jgi:ATP-dependent Clp endopeptidase proteolytic subunit ClpP